MPVGTVPSAVQPRRPARPANPDFSRGDSSLLSRLFRAALAALSLAAVLGLPATVRAADPPKVAIIVGPVGSLTPTYLALAERAAATAQAHGATVARAYSPNATPATVLAAVADAKIVIYFGHGYGHPSPYGGLNTAKQNGWALQGPAARGTHGDAGAELEYYGEDWIVANARPAPGFVMIYSNTCYAPGASEGVAGHPPATSLHAAQRVAYYSRSTFALGGSAYFATDFDHGAADLVDRMLGNPDATYGTAFVGDARYVPSGLSTQPHHFSAGQQIWLHHSKYTDGPPNYWYAFAGNPDVAPRRAWDPVAPAIGLHAPGPNGVDVPPNASVTLAVSEALVGVSASTVRLLDGTGSEVAASLSYDAAAGRITLQPSSALRLSERYDVVVSAGIVDEAGNPLAPAKLSFRTRVDADPLVEPLAAVLEPGSHQLIRLGENGVLAERRTIELVDAQAMTVSVRARLEGRPGTWLQLADGDLAGWWIAESNGTHAEGIVEEALLDAGTAVPLPPRSVVYQLSDGALQPISELVLPGERSLEVDRRIVWDGRTLVRAAMTENGLAGTWVEVAPTVVPGEATVQRLLERQVRSTPATISLAAGDWTAFRFDDRGRVIERRTIDGGAAGQGLASLETLIVGGRRFLTVSGGDLDGWAIADTPAVSMLISQPAPESRP